MQTLIYTISFLVVCFASHKIGKYFSAIQLPYITGYIFAGALVASFGLDFIPSTAADDLRYIEEMALAVIAFVAGSELYIKDVRKRLRNILFNTAGIVVAVLSLVCVTIFFMTEYIAFTQGMPLHYRIATAILGGTVLLALSPPSTIAVIKEVRAKGPFTRTALSVTVFMDVVIIILFAITTSVAAALMTGGGLDLQFLLQLATNLSLAMFCGYLAGKGLELILSRHIPRLGKILLVLAVGYTIYFVAGQVRAYSGANLPFEIYIEPLLISMVAGFFMTNFTNYRGEFEGLLHDVGPPVYVAFFTLTGISLSLDVLWTTLPFAIGLFGVRVVGIFIGSYVGGTLGGSTEDMPARHRLLSWMALITQAGIALGLAREVAVQFPALGDAFATLIISVVVLNEIFGPIFLKSVLKRVGEANIPEVTDTGAGRNAVIFGIESQSITLARTLREHNWKVKMVDTHAERVQQLETEDVNEIILPEINPETLSDLITTETDAVVAMLEEDRDNLTVCEFAYERFGIDRLVVRLRNPVYGDQFRELGALVVDTGAAMVHLLDQAVRAPQSAALTLHLDTDREVTQLRLENPDLDGYFVRDLHLPGDVLLLDISRDGHSIVPHGHTLLRSGDELTVVGQPDSLEEVAMRIG